MEQRRYLPLRGIKLLRCAGCMGPLRKATEGRLFIKMGSADADLVKDRTRYK
jgi:hypothetical protein